MTTSTELSTDAPASDEAVGRRERKKRATWLALHDAALALSVEKGFEHVTVEEICDRVDVSVRTFFNYFPCKEDAVLGGTQGFEDIADRLRQRPADESPLEALRVVYVEKMHTLGERGDWIRDRQRLIAANDALRVRDMARIAEFETVLATVVAERTGLDLDTDPYPRLVAAVAMSVLRTAFRTWQLDQTASLPGIVDAGFAGVMGGLVPPAPAPRRRRTTS